MKNLNEEINRIKSLFGENRLYGNLVTESSTSKFGWIDTIIRMLDDTHPKKLLGNKKWSKFSNRVKNGEGFMDELRKSVEYQKFIDEEITQELITVISSVITKGGKAKLSDNLLSKGVWGNIKKTISDNGIDLTNSVNYKNQTQSVGKHLDDMWDTSTYKTSIDGLQENIENLLSKKELYSMGEEQVDELVSVIRQNFSDELNLLKTADEGDDILEYVTSTIKKAGKTDMELTPKEIAAAVKLSKEAIRKESQLIGQKKLMARKNVADEWASKYSSWLNGSMISAVKKEPFNSQSAIPKLLGWIRSFNKNDSNNVFSLYFKDGLLPLRPFFDLLGFYPGRVFHKGLHMSGALKKSFNEMSTFYKISVLTGSLAIQDKVLMSSLDVIRYILREFESRGWWTYYGSSIKKNQSLIWDVGNNECYERKYGTEDVYDVNVNGEKWDEGEGIFVDDTEFNKLEEDITVFGKTKGEFQRYIRNERKDKSDDKWLPEDFCEKFICDQYDKPIEVKCGRYNILDDIGINSEQEFIDLKQEGVQVANRIVDELTTLDLFPVKLDSIGTGFNDKISTENMKKTLDELISKGDTATVALILKELSNGVLNMADPKDANAEIKIPLEDDSGQ
jgi:hypothetical protein